MLLLGAHEIAHHQILDLNLVLLRHEGEVLLLSLVILQLHQFVLVTVHFSGGGMSRGHVVWLIAVVVVEPTLRVDLVLVIGITCAGRVKLAALPRVLYTS